MSRPSWPSVPRPVFRTCGVLGALGVGALLTFTACSSGSDGVSVDDAWGRPTAGGTNVAAFYGVITNDSDVQERLVSAASSRCDVTQIHLSTLVDGVMSMAEADRDVLVMDPGESLVLEPGGLHLMCMGLDAALVVGETADATLTFETAGEVDVAVEVEQR